MIGRRKSPVEKNWACLPEDRMEARMSLKSIRPWSIWQWLTPSAWVLVTSMPRILVLRSDNAFEMKIHSLCKRCWRCFYEASILAVEFLPDTVMSFPTHAATQKQSIMDQYFKPMTSGEWWLHMMSLYKTTWMPHVSSISMKVDWVWELSCSWT